MRKMKLCILLLGFNLTIKAQEALANGGNATGSGGTISYSIGQVAYTSIIGTSGTIAQGVQQAFEISTISELNDTTKISLQCTTYPNPTNNYLKLKLKYLNGKNLSFILCDLNGKILQNRRINELETAINLSSYISGSYLLKIIENKIKIKTFKVIKN